MSKLNIEVGKTYMSRGSEIVTIDIFSKYKYSFWSNLNGCWYMNDGRCMSINCKKRDLISEVITTPALVPHKHAELIIAWANGAEIEVLSQEDWYASGKPIWELDAVYRIKPTPVLVPVAVTYLAYKGSLSITATSIGWAKDYCPNADAYLKVTYDHNTKNATVQVVS